MLSSFIPTFLLSFSVMQDVKRKKQQNEKGEEKSVNMLMKLLRTGSGKKALD